MDWQGDDISLSKQEGSMTRHLVSAQWDWPACVFIMDTYKAIFSVVWRADLRRPD